MVVHAALTTSQPFKLHSLQREELAATHYQPLTAALCGGSMAITRAIIAVRPCPTEGTDFGCRSLTLVAVVDDDHDHDHEDVVGIVLPHRCHRPRPRSPRRCASSSMRSATSPCCAAWSAPCTCHPQPRTPKPEVQPKPLNSNSSSSEPQILKPKPADSQR